MKEKILEAIENGVEAIQQLAAPERVSFIEEAAALLISCFRKGNKVLIAGNGGSLCDATHFAEELTGLFRELRPALPALALSDPGYLTCVGNDMGFEQVFARGVEAFGKEGDVFVGLSTSGNSPNIIAAFERARSQGLKTVAFLGKGGGKLKGVADYELIIEGFSTSDRIQEAHMTTIHILIERIEAALFRRADQDEIVEELLETVSPR